MAPIDMLEEKVWFPRLKEIPQPPKKLFIRGNMPPAEAKLLTVVGSRKFSSYGKMACEHLISSLRGNNISIVSGLALGIDTIAHKAALSAGLHTIAIPGSGLDDAVLYPRTNQHLAYEILKKGGMLLSEFEPDFRATPWSFPQRNRLMAGIAGAVLIIEAHEKSGTLITARMAVDYNRDVLVVPGSIFSESSCGTNSLIRLGATPIRNSDDILEALHIEKKESKNDADVDTSLSSHEQKIIVALSEPLSKDELMRLEILPAHALNATLTLLEIKEIIKEHGGKLYRL